MKCASKVKTEVPDKYARCTNGTCRLFQSLSDTPETFAATLILRDGDKHTQVRAFHRELNQIANGDINEIKLMEANPFSCTVSHNVINKVWRTSQ